MNSVKKMKYEERGLTRGILVCTVAGSLALGLSACDRQQGAKPEQFGKGYEAIPQQQSADSGAPPPAVRTEVPAPGDVALASRVKSAISSEPALKSVTVDVVALDGIVTLNGTADTPATSDHAAKIALNVDGVRSVKNELIIVKGS